MNIQITFFAVLICGCLTSCGGGGGDDNSNSANNSPPPLTDAASIQDLSNIWKAKYGLDFTSSTNGYIYGLTEVARPQVMVDNGIQVTNQTFTRTYEYRSPNFDSPIGGYANFASPNAKKAFGWELSNSAQADPSLLSGAGKARAIYSVKPYSLSNFSTNGVTYTTVQMPICILGEIQVYDSNNRYIGLLAHRFSGTMVWNTASKGTFGRYLQGNHFQVYLEVSEYAKSLGYEAFKTNRQDDFTMIAISSGG